MSNWKVNGEIQEKGKSLLDRYHPINSLFFSLDPTSPAELFGGSWEELPSNITLWTTSTDSNDAGETIEAGLPNITGGFRTNIFAGNSGLGFDKWGAFIGSNAVFYSNSAGSGSAQTLNGMSIDFKASNLNQIYGNSSTVQPPAIKTYAWKRIG